MLSDGNEREDSVSRIDNISALNLQRGAGDYENRYIETDPNLQESMLDELKIQIELEEIAEVAASKEQSLYKKDKESKNQNIEEE